MSESYIYGIHAVNNLLKNPKRNIKLLYIKEDRADKRIQTILNLAKEQNITCKMINVLDLDKKFPDARHQGVVALAEALTEFSEKDLPNLVQKKSLLILIIDGITDPHNLGACLRTADGAGVDFVIVPKDKNAHITPVVSKVASGAAETIPVIKVTNLARAMEILKENGVWIYGAADESAQSLYTLDLKDSVAIVLGSEDKGLRRLTRENCDGLFSIPMSGSVSSLNVSVAGAIALYEAVRQRLA